MQRITIIFAILLLGGGAYALPAIDGAVVRSAKKSLLKRVDFQKTDTDLSFADNMKIMADSYEAYYTEYDASGRCVKNCAYPGITLAQERELRRLATNVFARDVCVLEGGGESDCNARYCTDSGCDVVAYAERVKNEADSSGGNSARSAVVPRVANVRQERIAMGTAVVAAKGSIVGPVTRRVLRNVMDEPLVVISAGGERIAAGTSYHAGVDLMAENKQQIYAPRDGVVHSYVSNNGAAGNTLTLFHTFKNDNAASHAGSYKSSKVGTTYHYFTRYMHLAGPAKGVTTKGQEVKIGDVIAYAGNTGGKYGVHLHYEFGIYIDFPNSGDMKISIDLLGTDTNWDIVNAKYKHRTTTRYSDGADVFKKYNMLGLPYWMRYSASNPDKSISNPLFKDCVKTYKSDLRGLAQCVASRFVGCQGILNCVDGFCGESQKVDAYEE